MHLRGTHHCEDNVRVCWGLSNWQNIQLGMYSLKRLSVALYGHGFCSHMRLQMFRQLLRHGVAYFDEDRQFSDI